MDFDRSWGLLESIQGHIRAFDAKAQVAIGINGVLVGFLISEFTKAAELAALGFPWRFASICIVTGLSVLCSLTAIILGVRVVHPQLHLRQPHSRFFFCHIAEEFGRDFIRAGDSLASLSDEESLKGVTTQISVNAYVCNVKSKRCKPTLALTAAAFLLYAVSIFPFASMALSASRIPGHSATPAPVTLTVCQRYIERLLKNAKVLRYLERRHDRSLVALQLWLEKRQLTS